MAKIQLLAILSIDGCLANMDTEGRWWLRPDCHGISDIYNKATFELSPDYSMTTLIAEHEKQDDNTVYLIEATHQNADFINALLNMRIVDEIIIYTVPFIAGTGFFLFQKNLPISYWKLTACSKMEREMRIQLFQNETRFHLETFFWPFIQWLKNIFISILLYNSRIQNPAVFFMFAEKHLYS